MLNYQLTTFDNRLKLITAPLTNTKAMSLLFLVAVGSRYEKESQNGLSHFLEHMFFKGTQKRPKTQDLAKALDAVGASYNAFTGEEHTGFFVRSASEHFELALDILFDMLYYSRFSPAEIEREKGVIIEEINMYQDTPQSYIEEVAKKLFYGNQPLGREIVGTKETVKALGQQDFFAYRDRFYTPDNMIVACAGGQNKTPWEAKIKKYFGKMNLKKQDRYEKIKESQRNPEILIHHKKNDQAHLILGFRTIPRTDKRRPILKVLSNLLGETMSSRLFTEVREQRGLAYYVLSEIDDFQDCGAFGAAAGVDIRRAEEAVKVILAEFGRLKIHKVAADELHKAKENLKGKLYLALEESLAVAEFLAEQELFWGKIDTPEELIAKFEKVTAEDIQQFAQEFFRAKNLNLAMIGPFKNKEKFQKILEGFK